MSVRATPPSVRATPQPVGAADVSTSQTRLQQVLTVGLSQLKLGEETGARLKKKKAPSGVNRPHRYRPGVYAQRFTYRVQKRIPDKRERPEMTRLLDQAYMLDWFKGFADPWTLPTDDELNARMRAWDSGGLDPPPYGKEQLLNARKKYLEYRAAVDAEAARNGEPSYKYEYAYLMAQLEKTE